MHLSIMDSRNNQFERLTKQNLIGALNVFMTSWLSTMFRPNDFGVADVREGCAVRVGVLKRKGCNVACFEEVESSEFISSGRYGVHYQSPDDKILKVW